MSAAMNWNGCQAIVRPGMGFAQTTKSSCVGNY